MLDFQWIIRSIAASFLLALSACGGGGGQSASPTLTVLSSASLVRVGEAFSLTWSSTDTETCSGSSGLPGTLATRGTAEVTVSDWGRPSYTITCTGSGRSVSRSVTLTVPAPVYESSYQNKNGLALSTTNMPSLWDPSMVNVLTPTAISESWSPRSLALADFYQEGQYSMFVAGGKYLGAFPGNNPDKRTDSPGRV
ncbi:MAG: hypothetical protein ACO26U_13815, partial [Burkholderiaceae bacterium]